MLFRMFSAASNKILKEWLKDSFSFLIQSKSGSRLFWDWLTEQFNNVSYLCRLLQNIFGFPLMVAKQLPQLHSHQTPPMVGWIKGIGDILWCIHFFFLWGRKILSRSNPMPSRPSLVSFKPKLEHLPILKPFKKSWGWDYHQWLRPGISNLFL